MGAIAPIKIASALDGVFKTPSATVGVDTTLSPEGFTLPGVTSWVDRSGGIPLGYKRFTLQHRPPTKDSPVYKISAKLFFPVLEETEAGDGIFGPQKAYELQCHMDFLVPARSTSAQRIAFFCNVASLFAATITASDGSPTDATGTPLIAAVDDLEPVY